MAVVSKAKSLTVHYLELPTMAHQRSGPYGNAPSTVKRRRGLGVVANGPQKSPKVGRATHQEPLHAASSRPGVTDNRSSVSSILAAKTCLQRS